MEGSRSRPRRALAPRWCSLAVAALLVVSGSACGAGVSPAPGSGPSPAGSPRSGAAPPSPVAQATPAPVITFEPSIPQTPPEFVESDGPVETTASGLMYIELEPGTGPSPQPGQTVAVHYTGWLVNGTRFDSSLERGQPLTFPIGTGQVIPGWEEGVSTMRVGGKRRLIIPPSLAYGSRGNGPIPPNATIVFDVELVAIAG